MNLGATYIIDPWCAGDNRCEKPGESRITLWRVDRRHRQAAEWLGLSVNQIDCRIEVSTLTSRGLRVSWEWTLDCENP
jgi:hypothetical protein